MLKYFFEKKLIEEEDADQRDKKDEESQIMIDLEKTIEDQACRYCRQKDGGFFTRPFFGQSDACRIASCVESHQAKGDDDDNFQETDMRRDYAWQETVGDKCQHKKSQQQK